MRIISGKFKGRRLAPLKGNALRPTSDRVKEALFSSLGERVIDSDFLDLCAGTGNIGIEALGRGAESVTFIDQDYQSTRLIAANLEQCGIPPKSPQVRIIKQDVRRGLRFLVRQHIQFDLIYFDPPYDSNIYHDTLNRIAGEHLLSESGLIIVEHRKHQDLNSPGSPITGELAFVRHKTYGETVLSFYALKCEKQL